MADAQQELAGNEAAKHALAARKLRKALRDLTDTVQSFLVLLDHEMKKPSSPERGARVAELAGKLELKNDMVRRFVLELGFNGRPLRSGKKRAA